MLFSDPDVLAIFTEYDQRHQSERERMQQLPPGAFGELRDEFLLPIGARVGGYLRSLVIAQQPARILELGTSYGYSTLFLADAARENGSKLVSVDVDAAKQDYARNMMQRAGLADHVEFRCGDALDIIAQDQGKWDFVLLDIWKNLYLPCFDAVYPKLAEEGILVSDNMIAPASAREAVRAYRGAVRGKPDLQTMLLPIGSGIEMSIRWTEGNPKL
ncbi:putative O-methyltransferase YrrM [Altererythrobacter atlanticus]|uniref:O-methyltransferase n=1 Tax=Croceibacterium atlanticum TaxID=1267766 RepID=A0A0F7KYV3_9SPHN|nr:class I SAM-dependent methyltransferase [Croceibacterium atlanticum]AKH44000.1 O-methyltransferase [Croceibacterium atlanticum]MBB5732306.1 putative O-methyltransferase YrrM [Croceibacterium atlanticum]